MKTVFVDVDTQIDFLFPAGALYVPGAEQIVGTLADLNRYAAGRQIPVISTVDAHTENDREFLRWPAHCVAGTVGQQKPQATLVENRTVLSSKPRAALPSAPQIVLEKQHNDPFTNPNLDRLLDSLGAERYVVYGVVTEICVRCAAFGLLQRGGRVELATDAVRSLDQAEADRMFEEFTAAGGVLTTADAVRA